jgi:hypothetical protein
MRHEPAHACAVQTSEAFRLLKQGGTWDITVSDWFDDDVSAFKKDFPALSNASIDRDVLPPWDKLKATDWWASH